MKYLSKGSWDRELNSPEDVNIVFMGAEKVGKKSVIKSVIRQLERKGKDHTKSIYECRERTTGSTPPGPVSLALRREAMKLGDIFVLVFAIDDQSSFDYVQMLKDELLEIKGFFVPIIVVGNKADLRKYEGSDPGRFVSFPFADLMVCVDWDRPYEEVSVKKNAGFKSLVKSIEKQEQSGFFLSQK